MATIGSAEGVSPRQREPAVRGMYEDGVPAGRSADRVLRGGVRRRAASLPVAGWPLADLPARLQALDVPGKLGCGRRGDALRDCHAIECCCEVGQGRCDDSLCRIGAERIPPFGFADKVRCADAPVVEAAVESEGQVVVIRSRWKRFGTAS
jgi:hypothetical protein